MSVTRALKRRPVPQTMRTMVSASSMLFSSVGMTDESCCLVFGRCQGTPTSIHQENTEDIQVVLADRAECRRILAQEQVAIQCAYMLMHFVSSQDNPFAFLEGEHHV